MFDSTRVTSFSCSCFRMCILTLLVCLGTPLTAATHTAQALTPESVLAAVRKAQDGDTVQLPESTAVWSKGWNTGTWVSMKAITIQGAGVDKTVIVDNTSTAGGDEPFFVKGVEGKPFRITGITFQGWDGEHYRDAGSWSVISIDGACRDWRIDHCRFLNLPKGLQVTGDTCGLIDHCSFEPLVFGKCDGTSPYDGNLIPAGQPGAGYPSMDQPGRRVDVDGDGVQEAAPWYAWNNTLNGSKIGMEVRLDCPAVAEHVKAGRDFYNDTPMPGYKPYTYPHPLQASSALGPVLPAEGRGGGPKGDCGVFLGCCSE